MDCQYFVKLILGGVGLSLYLLFRGILNALYISIGILVSHGLATILEYGVNGYKIHPMYEAVLAVIFVVIYRSHFFWTNVEASFIKWVASVFRIDKVDLKFWEVLIEVNVILGTLIFMGFSFRNPSAIHPEMIERVLHPSLPIHPEMKLPFIYLLGLFILTSISSGKLGCIAMCGTSNGAKCLCMFPPNSLDLFGYKLCEMKSLATFVVLLVPNLALALAISLLLNGFYSVGLVVGLENMLTFYWMLFAGVLVGLGFGALENRNPFPQAKVVAPYFAFVNNFKAQSSILHFIALPLLTLPLFNSKGDIFKLEAKYDEFRALQTNGLNFRLFAILASLVLVLQVKLAVGLLRLAYLIQKERTRRAAPPPQGRHEHHPIVHPPRIIQDENPIELLEIEAEHLGPNGGDSCRRPDHRDDETDVQTPESGSSTDVSDDGDKKEDADTNPNDENDRNNNNV